MKLLFPAPIIKPRSARHVILPWHGFDWITTETFEVFDIILVIQANFEHNEPLTCKNK